MHLHKHLNKAYPFTAQASTHHSGVKKRYPEQFSRTDIGYESLRLFIVGNRNKPCRYCGRPATSVDHVIPLSRGGEHRFDNLQLICNLAKSDRLPEEYLAHVQEIVKHQGTF